MYFSPAKFNFLSALFFSPTKKKSSSRWHRHFSEKNKYEGYNSSYHPSYHIFRRGNGQANRNQGSRRPSNQGSRKRPTAQASRPQRPKRPQAPRQQARPVGQNKRNNQQRQQPRQQKPAQKPPQQALVKSLAPSSGGNKAASAGSGGKKCPGGSLEMCIDVCPSFSARIFGACVSGCAKRCPAKK